MVCLFLVLLKMDKHTNVQTPILGDCTNEKINRTNARRSRHVRYLY